MKICLITNLYPPNILGGAEVVVSRFAEQFAERGHDVFVITTSPGRKATEEINNGVKIYRINPFNVYTTYDHPKKSTFLKPFWHVIDLWNPHSYLLVKKILEKEKPGILHIHNYKGLSLSVFDAARKTGKPVIFTAHDYSLICPRANLLTPKCSICMKPGILCRMYSGIQKKLLTGKIDVALSPSKYALGKLKENGFFKDAETFDFPNAINIMPAKATTKSGGVRILYVGGLAKHKGVGDLIAAFKDICGENLALDVVGEGPDASILKKSAAGDSRIFFHGRRKPEEISGYYLNASLLVVPSVWLENSPTVIYEAFSFGVPVLGGRIGGIPELIEEGVNGALFEAGNRSDLKDKLETLIRDSSRLKRMGTGALASSKKYDLKISAERLEQIYLEAIKGKLGNT